MTPDPTPGVRHSDQPGIVYSFKRDDDDKKQIRKVIQSGYGEKGPSPGDICELENTKSDPNTRMPKGDIPGRRDYQQPDCGDERPLYACNTCGTPVHVGRTCKSPHCRRCWAANVFERTVKIAGQLEALKMYQHSSGEARGQVTVRQHWSATAPTGFAVDSDQPIEHGKKIIKELFRRNFGIENLQVHYHPWGIDQDQDIQWADVLDNRNNWKDKVVYRPHFHVLFIGFADKSQTEAIQEKSGWILNRHEREIEGKMVSVEDLEDLVRQVMYNLSHSYVEQRQYGWQIWARQLGETLHNQISYIPEDVRERVEQYAREHSPKLLGVEFADVAGSTCSERIEQGETTAEGQPVPADGGWHRQTTADHNTDLGPTATAGAGIGASGGRVDLPPREEEDQDDWTTGSSTAAVDGDQETQESNNTEVCGGDIVPIQQAARLLEDQDWREQAVHADALEQSYRQWQRLVGDEAAAPDYDGSVPPPEDKDDIHMV